MARRPDPQFPHATTDLIKVDGSVNGFIILKTVTEPVQDFGGIFIDGNLLEAEQNADRTVALWNAAAGAVIP